MLVSNDAGSFCSLFFTFFSAICHKSVCYVFRQYFPLRLSSFDVSTIRSRIHVLLARRKLLCILIAILAPWCEGFSERMVRSVKDLLIRTGNFKSKGKSGRQICFNEMVQFHDVQFHDEDTKRLMWSTGLVTELRQSRDGIIRSVFSGPLMVTI